jgi:hypothetical protein
MKIFFDTEFTGLHQHTTLISIGCIAHDGRTFYAEFSDYDRDQVDDWLRDNVIAHLWHPDSPTLNPRFDPESPHLSYCGERPVIAELLAQWLGLFDRIEMWSDCLAYDWVLFCELFGGALNIPKNVFYIPFDICTLFQVRGFDPDISREEFVSDTVYSRAAAEQGHKHHALHDARIIKMCYERLVGQPAYRATRADAQE